MDTTLEGVTLTKCPSCQTAYPTEQIREVMREGQKCVLHATCSSCQDAIILSVTKRPGGVICAGLLSDCNYDDAVRFAKAPRITADQVLDAHEASWLDILRKFL